MTALPKCAVAPSIECRGWVVWRPNPKLDDLAREREKTRRTGPRGRENSTIRPASTRKLDDLVLGRISSKKLDQAAEPGLLAGLLASWPPEWPPGAISNLFFRLNVLLVEKIDA